MRNMILTLWTLLLAATLPAQGVFSNKTQAILEKVIQDYPNRFYNIKGDLIQQTRQTTEYRSTIQLPGSSSSIVMHANAPMDDQSSWTSAVLETGDFDQAKQKFLEIYGQIRNSIITIAGQKTFILTGQYEDSGEKNFTHVVFSLLPRVGEVKKLKVELSLRREPKGYKIALSVYDHDPKEVSPGAITAN
jgi:hypothetical protein